uniref:Uncharacterized protein n=1 Tax=Alexandrium catenella TaxID=2925 RepID=A0A7S1PKI6_ALECA|mmetsp:Transcript_101729/g.270626  ORF Transcript_101729/g.270626 Transcript_101729/m.270626 type:complete len:247 (+) Transcript_101729:75-815(+)|eukprot:CAMPEP_0171209762 /NCGR_PEP_ID=MMETSP0790-20130122/28760_1 /TAXON_ID=2925 /ORGANISM="Alexandrium catenella, Strain OF101" /LENGTH=246 /DNA_ID=CAMNT_0011675377 /DNA_START=63 /DNA_END=803 /DNA_ORIENTATION=+
MSTAHYGRAVPLALRRFARLRCQPRVMPGTPLPPQLEIPSGLPAGVHVVLLLRRRRHIEHCDSWLSVREAWERALAERGLQQEGELRLYICCMMPRFWPMRLFWHWRMRGWVALLEKEEQPAVQILSCSSWSGGFYERMRIHDDGRAYAMVIRNDGEILWASHDAFKEHLQEKAMAIVVRQECHWRETERQLLLDGPAKAGAIESPDAKAPDGTGVAEAAGEHPPSSGEGGKAEGAGNGPGEAAAR